MAKRTCDVPECGRPHQARGMCSRHYGQWKLTDNPNRVACSIDGCDKVAVKRGWCDMHYQRWSIHGDPATVIVKTRSVCDFETCERYVVSHGLCEPHNRQRSEGKELSVIREHRPHAERDEQGRKLCRRCKQWLPEDTFGASSRNRDGRSYMCMKCNRDTHRLANYGLTWDKYQEMLANQGGGCAICGEQCSSGRMLAVDHDHACCPGSKSCGACVRGLLCGNCNHGIGKFRDDVALLKAALEYLGETGCRT